jgi:multiple sugar transport system permease protein
MKESASYTPPTRTGSWLAALPLAAVAVLFVYPFLWMLLAGFKTNREIFHPLDFWPAQFDPQYYRDLLRGDWFPCLRVFANSWFVALGQAIGAVTLASMAGYVFARHRFRGRRLLFLLSVTVIVVPQQMLAIPLFAWLNTLRLGDCLWGVILPGTVTGLGVVYFTQVFRHVPDDLVDSARLAGASEFQVYRTLLPLISSALLSFGFVQFILAWHEHLLPLLVLNSPDRQTLPLALASLYGSSLRYPYAVLMAASTLALLPTAFLFGLLYRRFKSSLTDVLGH